MSKVTSLALQSIEVAQYERNDGGQTYSVIGLDKQGRVWRYDHKHGGWRPLEMKALSNCPCDKY